MKSIALPLFASVLISLAAASPVIQELSVVRKPFACPPEDPLITPPGCINVTLDPIFALHEGSCHQGIVATGLSGLVTEINIIIITLTATFKVDLPSLDVQVSSSLSTGYIDLRPFLSIPSGNYSADDDASVVASHLHVEGSATLFINIIGNRVNIRTLTISVLHFDSLCLDLGQNFRVAGNPVDWVDFCQNVKTRFDAEFANTQLRNQLVEKARQAANAIVGQYTLDELLELIGGGDGEPCEP